MRRRFRMTALVVGLVVAGSQFAGAATSADPLQHRQWSLDLIGAPSAWSYATGSGAVVAVVDTGVDVDHPELERRLVHGASCIDADDVDDCDETTGAWDDGNGHGTHVAGIIAAPDDGAGIVGVAPDARIMPVRVLDEDGRGSSRDVATGIDYAVAHGAHVINLSLGGLPVVSQLTSFGALESEFSRAIDRAAAAQRLVVVSAGNDAFPVCSHKVFLSGAGICVGATDRRDLKSWYSNFGGGLDVTAPGGAGSPCRWAPWSCERYAAVRSAGCQEGVLSTYLAEHASPCGFTDGYAVLAGTSMAAPHVSGIGALLVERGVRGAAAAERIADTAHDRGVPGYDEVYGHGRVDAHRAVVPDTSFSWSFPGS